MPLFNKLKFIKKPIPDDLNPNEQVFFSKLTLEIFRDYDEYFERTILCNSLVWTCSLTGRTGLTYAEAIESEEKAVRLMEKFPNTLEKPILYLISLTKRGNIKDLIDDLFSYTKDRYFIGEHVILTSPQSPKSEANKGCKIVDVILTTGNGHQQQQLNSSKCEEFSEATGKSRRVSQSGASDSNCPVVKYVVEIQLNGNPVRQTVKGSQLCRLKNQLTKDKIYIIVKLNCEVTNQMVWTLTDEAMRKHQIEKMTFADFYRGEAPHFEQTFGRGQFSRAHMLNRSIETKSTPNKSQPKQQQQQNTGKANSAASSKNAKSMNKKASPTSSTNANKNNQNHAANKKSSKTATGAAASANEPSSDDDSTEIDENDPEANEFAHRIVQILEKKVIDMDDEEFEIWRDYTPDDDCKELKQLEIELEKIVKKEEKEKERERIKNEKNKQKEYLKELKKPKEDLECDNSIELPKPVPIKSKITQEMFGDAIMILEFLNNFGDLFELKDDFPNGFNFDLLENALFSKSCDSALCNLLLFFLDSVFKCYDEEMFDDSNAADSDNESRDEDDDSDNEDGLPLEKLYQEPHKQASDRESISQQADSYFKLIKNIQGRSLKTIGLDVYTISEMLRLYFITSGASHHSKIKYWYQQRGGYTQMDETGIDFALNEKEILKKLEKMNVYELEPNEKLKILTCLCHQLMSQVRFRDLIEDNFQKLNTLRAQLRDLQTEENRRLREEVSERWKKKMMDKQKEKARIEEIKTNANTSSGGSANNHSVSSTKELSSITNDIHKKELELVKISEQKLLMESNKKKEEFLKKEKKILDEIGELQMKYCMCPLGKDRYYRRYWTFKSLPGVFVEDDDDDDNGEFDGLKSNFTEISAQSIKTEDKESLLGGGGSMMSNANDDSNNNTDGKENKPENLSLKIQNGKLNSTTAAADFNTIKSCSFVKGEIKWSFYYTPELIEQLIVNLNERGLRESELRQNLNEMKQKIVDQIQKSTSIINNLTMSQEDIEKSLRNCLKENVYNVLANSALANSAQSLKNKRQIAKQAASLVNTVVSSLSNTSQSSITSQEHMEIDLRDKLLEIEEQIFIGALGSLKVNDRYKWKEALEKGQYDASCTNLVWGGDLTRPALECTNRAGNLKTPVISILSSQQNASLDAPLDTETMNVYIVNNFAKVLLQIEQSMEKRFIRMPLGDAHKTPDKRRGQTKSKTMTNGGGAGDSEANSGETSGGPNAGNSLAASKQYSTLFHWEKSLMNCTTLSQIFIHLQTLDESIAWSKSALNAKCRICKKKGEPEKMILCDKCDHGHHIFCLRPPLSSIPDGEWFCPKCRPKDVEKTPRKIRKSFINCELYSDESGNEMYDSETDNNSHRYKKRKNEMNGNNNEEENGAESAEENDEENEPEKVTKKSKGRASKQTYSDEEALVNESGDDSDKRRSNRKRKITNDKAQSKSIISKIKNNNKISSSSLTSLASTASSSMNSKEGATSDFKVSLTRSGRNRNKAASYYELSDELSTNETDDDSCQKNKRAKKSEKLNAFNLNNTSSRNTELAHRVKIVEKIMNDIMKHPDAWPFLKPVSRRKAPDYFEHIKKPMDFSTIKNNINNFKYTDYTKIIDDIRLVFENCKNYNEPGSDIYETGERLLNQFDEQAKAAGLLDYSTN